MRSVFSHQPQFVFSLSSRLRTETTKDTEKRKNEKKKIHKSKVEICRCDEMNLRKQTW